MGGEEKAPYAEGESERTLRLEAERILREEVSRLDSRNSCEGSGRDLYRQLRKLDRTALCLSGGGIRSAAFNLGIVQALAHQRSVAPDRGEAPTFLEQVDYLSTVSGGGYIGGWMTAVGSSLPNLIAVLTARPASPTSEPLPLAWLRQYSNFLTPRMGLSADFLSAIATILRNLILNWLIIIPLIMIAVLLTKLFGLSVAWLGTGHDGGQHAWLIAEAICCVALFGAGLATSVLNQPSVGWMRLRQRGVVFGVIAPTIVGTLLLAVATANRLRESDDVIRLGWHAVFVWGAGLGALLYGLVAAVAHFASRRPQQSILNIAARIAEGAIFGSLVVLGASIFTPLKNSLAGASPALLLFVLGPSWIILSRCLASVIYVGLTSRRPLADSDREWSARAEGFFLAFIPLWPIFTALVLAGPTLVALAVFKLKYLLGAGSISGVLSALLAKSSLTSRQKSRHHRSITIPVNVILWIAALTFGACLVIFLSWVIDEWAFGGAMFACDQGTKLKECPWDLPVLAAGDAWKWLGGALLGSILVGGLASYFVNINRFSLHALYRNRLIRAFLGAANTGREPNPFSGFDEADNPRLASFARGGTPRPLYPVVNVALNLISTKNLAWQERKAQSFTFTPDHCGSPCLGYQPTQAYGDPRGGVTLGTALAISGAAASPSMGYHSSEAMSLLMTLLNVRLGWWLANPGAPGKRLYRNAGPQFAIRPLLAEAFGLTKEEAKYVYLSDGGHFENLGLYEMIRRRCSRIIVIDASCDPTFSFEDLGNAARKIEIDLGVAIQFRGLEDLRTGAQKCAGSQNIPYHAVGTKIFSGGRE